MQAATHEGCTCSARYAPTIKHSFKLALRPRLSQSFRSRKMVQNFKSRNQLCRSSAESRAETQQEETAGTSGTVNGAGLGSESTERDANQSLDKEVTKFARSAATTFAPRASGATKNPAYKGSVLYTVFGVQAWLFLVVGGLLSFNLLFPSDEPNIARLIGMWSIWMFTIPALRARECSAGEKDVLNYLFLLIPILNVSLPFVWKSFAFIYSADVVALAALYAWKVGLPKAEEAS